MFVDKMQTRPAALFCELWCNQYSDSVYIESIMYKDRGLYTVDI